MLLDDIIDEEEKNGESVINKLEDEKSFVKLEYCDVELNAEAIKSFRWFGDVVVVCAD